MHTSVWMLLEDLVVVVVDAHEAVADYDADLRVVLAGALNYFARR